MSITIPSIPNNNGLCHLEAISVPNGQTTPAGGIKRDAGLLVTFDVDGNSKTTNDYLELWIATINSKPRVTRLFYTDAARDRKSFSYSDISANNSDNLIAGLKAYFSKHSITASNITASPAVISSRVQEALMSGAKAVFSAIQQY